MSTLLIVMAKAPVPGQAKTRLIPALGAQAAADLAHALLMDALARAARAQLGRVELCVSPSVQHPSFAHAQRLYGPRLTLTEQGEGDLGVRMQRALARGLHSHDKALLIGTDAPGLDAARLCEAAQTLDQADAVCVPALDGGYALVGLRATAPATWPGLFQGVSWSTSKVMTQTRERAVQAGLGLAACAPVADIDEASDLIHLPPGWPWRARAPVAGPQAKD